jgi:conjugal transfer pilus assembly protein TraD
MPDFSVCIDPLRAYQRSSQIANRIASLLPASGNSAAFRDFAWRAINVVVDGLAEAGAEPDLLRLRKYVEGDTDELVLRATERYFDRVANRDPLVSNWRSEVNALLAKTNSGLTVSLDKAAAAEAAARATYYITKLKKQHPDKTIEAMISVMMHDRQHYNKLISNLIPLLEQLTSGPLGRLLSPFSFEMDTSSMSTTFEFLVEHNHVVYINLDTLADSIVGQAVGSLFLADLTSVAAKRYSRQGGASDLPPVSVFVDEAAEMINDPFIQNLNKGRGAGFELYIASQTIADFVARMGNQAMAMQALGNTNTTIALRVVDPETREFVSKMFGETHYAESSEGRSSSTIDPSDVIDFRGMVTKTTQRKDIPLVSDDTLTKLPNLHYLAKLPGGKRIKGRVPIMPLKDSDRFVPEAFYSAFRSGEPSSARQDDPLPDNLPPKDIDPDTLDDEGLTTAISLSNISTEFLDQSRSPESDVTLGSSESPSHPSPPLAASGQS